MRTGIPVQVPSGNTDQVTSPQHFFALVELHVAQPMLDSGYAKIGELDYDGAGPNGGLLTAGPRWWQEMRVISPLRKRIGSPKVRVLQVGYEAGGDEKWLSYYPDTGELDLVAWRDTLDGHADWDVWHDRLVSGDGELERRIVVLGSALRNGLRG